MLAKENGTENFHSNMMTQMNLQLVALYKAPKFEYQSR